MTNLVAIARTIYPPQYRCRCGLIVRHLTDRRWVDGSGDPRCWDDTAHLGIPVEES